jgi:hypothetical protein
MKKIIVIISILLSLSLAWADDALKISCPGGVKANKFLAKNKYINSESYQTILSNEKDKCYVLNFAKFEYFIDNKHAIYKVYIDSDKDYISPQFFLFDFSTANVRWKQIGGVIKTTGTSFNCKTDRGVPLKIPRVIVVKSYKVVNVLAQ